MNAVERQRSKVIRIAKAFRHAADADIVDTLSIEQRLYSAVTELEAAEKLERARRRKAAGSIIYCRGCKRRHAKNVEHTFYSKGRRRGWKVLRRSRL